MYSPHLILISNIWARLLKKMNFSHNALFLLSCHLLEGSVKKNIFHTKLKDATWKPSFSLTPNSWSPPIGVFSSQWREIWTFRSPNRRFCPMFGTAWPSSRFLKRFNGLVYRKRLNSSGLKNYTNSHEPVVISFTYKYIHTLTGIWCYRE